MAVCPERKDIDMNTDAITADLQWLEDLYSNKMVELETADTDERKVIMGELSEINKLISQKEVLYERLTDVALNKEKNDMERIRLSHEEERIQNERDRITADRKIQKSKERIERKRIEAESRVKPLDLNTVAQVAGSMVSMFAVGFVELKAHGYLNDRLVKMAESIRFGKRF